MLDGFYPGCSVVLENDLVVHNVHSFKVLGELVLVAVLPGKPTDTYDYANIQVTGMMSVPVPLVWKADGILPGMSKWNISKVLAADPVETPTVPHHFIIAVDVRDNQPLCFPIQGCVISKQVQPLIKQLTEQYQINASTHHDEAMEDKFLDNCRKLKSADTVIRFDGHWWPVRFVKTVETINEAMELI